MECIQNFGGETWWKISIWRQEGDWRLTLKGNLERLWESKVDGTGSESCQWQALVLPMLNFWVLLPQCFFSSVETCPVEWPPSVYTVILPSSCLAVLSTWMLVVITFASDKHFEMANRLQENATDSRRGRLAHHPHNPWDFFMQLQYNSLWIFECSSILSLAWICLAGIKLTPTDL
jgi:hypothetical protein